MAGIVMVGFAGTAESENACIKPLPPSLIQKIQPDKTVSLSVTIDTPEHQQDEEYKEVAKRLREFLPAKLVDNNDGVFKAVVPAPETADYAIEVTITSANIPGKFATATDIGENEAKMTVRITNLETNQLIGNFEVRAYEHSLRTAYPDPEHPSLNIAIQRAVSEIVRTLNTVDYIYNSNSRDIDQKEREFVDSK
jgi:hypothetical protein